MVRKYSRIVSSWLIILLVKSLYYNYTSSKDVVMDGHFIGQATVVKILKKLFEGLLPCLDVGLPQWSTPPLCMVQPYGLLPSPSIRQRTCCPFDILCLSKMMNKTMYWSKIYESSMAKRFRSHHGSSTDNVIIFS